MKMLVERPKAYAGAFRGSTLVRPLPSLLYVFVATNGSIAAWCGNGNPRAHWDAEVQWHVTRAWRVVELRVGQPRLVELDDEVAETIIRREERLLLKTDKVSVVICTHGGSCQESAQNIPSPVV